eukprot:TRINITY_DN8962_c0_g1_i1.p1 TRINITY_DN8962_c0_g1~~TRINITY_DN8962_c0_g1_i1.p1  ORF type:complete len:545 (+),score=117.78 TRINITY_DN8962_c0_g1_i1:148-1782(+)
MTSCTRTTQSPLSHKDTIDVFQSQLGASEINMTFFSMPTSGVAKRLAIIGAEEGTLNRARNDSNSVGNSPVAASSDPYEPHPLNYTLDHAMTDEEAVERKQHEMDQLSRLRKHMQGTPLTIRQRDTQPLVIVLMGLPARGKTYISRRIMRYLAWMGVKTQVFNVAIYRRKNLGFPNAEFFNHENQENKTKLLEVAEQALKDMIHWIQEEKGQVAIFDGTNHSAERRQRIMDQIAPVVPRDRMMFIEMCDIMGGASETISQKEVSLMPEYIGIDPEKANSDFEQRVSYYKSAYQTLEKEEGVPFLKCYKDKMKMHRINGYLTGKLAFLLMNLKVMHRSVYLCLPGGTTELPEVPQVVSQPTSPLSPADDGVEEIIGPNDSSSARLRKISHKNMKQSQEGDAFARSLLQLLEQQIPSKEDVTIWSSNDSAGTDTIKYLQNAGYPTVYWRYLDACGFSVAEEGETYEDMIERLEPIIFEIERCPTHLLICGHGRVMNALHGYLSERGRSHMDPHTVVKIQPRAYDLECQTYEFKNSELVAKDEEDNS